MSNLTPAEIEAAFNERRNERTFDGVKFAEAITRITYMDGVITGVYDPASAGMKPEAFWQLFPWDNAAAHVGSPIVFNNPDSNELRKHVTRVDTFDADGSPRGSMTAAELYKMGTGEELSED